MSWKFAPFILLALVETTSCENANAATETPENATAEGPKGDDIDQIMRRFMTRLDAELDLSDDQEAQVADIFEHHVQQMRPHIEYIRKQSSRVAKRRAAMERKAELQKIRAATSEAMKGVLSETQFERFLELREEFRKQIAEKMRR